MDNSNSLKILHHDLGTYSYDATVYPLADLHIGSPGFNEKKFKALAQYITITPNTYCVLNGDILEMATKNSIGNSYEALRPRDQKNLAIELLGSLAEAGKILAYIDGNHELRASKEVDEFPGETICQALNIPELYSPDGVFLFLRVGQDLNANQRNTYTTFVLHGFSGARTSGGKANQLEAMAQCVVADCYIAGHVHQKMLFNKEIIVPELRYNSLKPKTQHFISTGSFLEWSGYAIRRGYSPASLGAPHIIFSGTKHNIKTVI